MKLLLPVAGMSSRFPGLRPKYLLTFPDGKLMIQKAIENIDFSRYSEVIVGPHIDHINKYISIEQLTDVMSESTSDFDLPIRAIPIHNSTSQADTCLQLLEELKDNFSFGINLMGVSF